VFNVSASLMRERFRYGPVQFGGVGAVRADADRRAVERRAPAEVTS
jgi:hypothetical protein